MYNMGIKIAFFSKAENPQYCRLSGNAFFSSVLNFSVLCVADSPGNHSIFQLTSQTY